MTALTFKGTPITTSGNFPTLGQTAPDFSLVTKDLSEISLSDLKGKKIVFNILPSIDTPVCALQLKKFNGMITEIADTVLLFSSLDLPFAFNRFCAAENIDNAITSSDYRHHSLAKNYGVRMNSGPLEGLYARAVIILDVNHQVIYSEIVSEVTNEPDYEAAMEALK
jgi:thiol peroxidase